MNEEDKSGLSDKGCVRRRKMLIRRGGRREMIDLNVEPPITSAKRRRNASQGKSKSKRILLE